jgi:hypothetical protein
VNRHAPARNGRGQRPDRTGGTVLHRRPVVGPPRVPRSPQRFGDRIVFFVGVEEACVVVPEDVCRIPDSVWWSHDEHGWAIGPDGSPLGLWASTPIRARRLLDGRLGNEELFSVGELRAVPDAQLRRHIVVPAGAGAGS